MMRLDYILHCNADKRYLPKHVSLAINKARVRERKPESVHHPCPGILTVTDPLAPKCWPVPAEISKHWGKKEFENIATEGFD
jgi:hypothetical protein